MTRGVFLLFLCFALFKINPAQISVADGRWPVAGLTTRTTIEEIHVDSVKNDSEKVVVKKKKWVTALLAFPLFGITGAHRVYLGTEPYIPLVYLATLGGFGILPLIDFIVILATPQERLEEYYNNGGVFMWGK